MPVITLTTDFGLKDHYAASLRGALIRLIPAAIVSDITHLVPSFDIGEAAYILGHAFREYPEGTVHIVAVGSGGGTRTRHVALKLENHYFIGCDNGLFSLLSKESPEEIVQLESRNPETQTFLAKDLYLPAAVLLAEGIPLAQLGNPLTGIAQRIRPVAPPEENSLVGTVAYVDGFRNLITNIARGDFERAQKGRKFIIEVIGDEITRIHRSYSDVPEGSVVAFFNSADMLEIAVNSGNAAELFRMRIGSVIRITFE
jgi:S-adenosyl-L-methionine hydrolase (adenosine-forming)